MNTKYTASIGTILQASKALLEVVLHRQGVFRLNDITAIIQDYSPELLCPTKYTIHP